MPTSLLSLIDPLSKSASVSSVYGEAFTANGKTIIPVARIAYGFGNGAGKEGEGGGGGVYAEPVGCIEVTDAETRFIAVNEKRKLAAAALAGFCLGAFWAWVRR
jgi:uncharacterized spore protein YtfJ